MEFYLRAPFITKRLMINIEALRRDYYRKFDDYEDLYNSIDFNSIMAFKGINTQRQKIEELLRSIKRNVAYYRELPEFSSLHQVPFMTKDIYSRNINKLKADSVKDKHCFKSRTSGSTGMPLTYINHRSVERIIKVYQEKYIEYMGINPKERSARISGVPIAPYGRKKPPYWVFIDKYNQLQLSSYHISAVTFESYLNAIKKYKVVYGKGYASAWLFLAEYIMLTKAIPPVLKAIITDSEGLTKDQQKFVEEAFKCPVYQTYGLGEIGQIAVQCRKGNYHIIPDLCYGEVVDEQGSFVGNGVIGEIVLTSLISEKTPFIRYKTGDNGILNEGLCECGWNSQYFTLIDGRKDDYVFDSNGRKIGRLSHIIKPAVGVVESQIIQDKIGEIKLLIIPGPAFDISSMNLVVKEARKYLGDMILKWETVDNLERTSSGKVRRVVRKI